MIFIEGIAKASLIKKLSKIQKQIHDDYYILLTTGKYDVLERLKYLDIKILIVNILKYKSIDERDDAILSHFKGFHTLSPYGLRSNIWLEDIEGQFTSQRYKCSMFTNCKCKIRKQHLNNGYRGVFEEPCMIAGNIDSPKYVFVGEAPGRCNKNNYGLPFYGDMSGDMFYEALFKCDILPTDVLIENTIHCCPDDIHSIDLRTLECARNLRTTLEDANDISFSSKPRHKVKIVALGRVADKLLDDFGIKHKFVYHPAYFIRKNNPKGFLKAMEGILK